MAEGKTITQIYGSIPERSSGLCTEESTETEKAQRNPQTQGKNSKDCKSRHVIGTPRKTKTYQMTSFSRDSSWKDCKSRLVNGATEANTIT